MSISRLLQPKKLLILICLFFLFTRLYKINEVPSSVYWDEASIGYNAYSILETGTDEWGKFLPIHFRAFGEFKLPVYIYSVVPFVKFFGLNEFSVRIPAVLFSLGVVLITFFLTKKLTGSDEVGLWSSFLITISPWFFIFSRTGYEATAGLMFYLLGIYFFLDLRKSGWQILFSTAAFILSAYSYNSFRIISPLTICILTIFFKDSLIQILNKQKYFYVISILLLILAVVPIYRLYAYDAGGVRLQAVKSSGGAIISNYLSHFNPHYLFISGDKNLRSQQMDFGQLYFPDLIFISIALIYIICRKSKNGFLVVLLLLTGPIPAALTKESPHALRSLSQVPFYAMLSAQGILYLKSLLKVKYLSIVVTVILLGFFSRYFINFLNVYPIQSSKDWQFPDKKIYTDYKDKFQKYDSIIISDEYGQPYIFALFYLKYDPQKFRVEVVRNSVDKWGFSTVSKFGKFDFRKVNLESNPQNNLVFTDKEIQSKIPVDSIKFLDGEIAFWVYQFKN